MPTYETKDGERFEAADLSDLIEQMHAAAQQHGEVEMRQWMHETAYRASEASGLPVYGDGTKPQLARDLIKVGLVKLIEE